MVKSVVKSWEREEGLGDLGGWCLIFVFLGCNIINLESF